MASGNTALSPSPTALNLLIDQNKMLTRFDYQHIDEYQIEITTYCNAACPQCPRNILGAGINPYMHLTHLSRSTIDQAFTPELCQRLRQVFFCGSYGDPIMHPDFLEILQDFRRKNSLTWLYMHTNGGIRDPGYWRQIAHAMAGHGQIDFGIDGLEDTLAMYRQNVVWRRVIDNAQAFIDAGGRAQWNFIVFEHNEHQVDEAKSLSQRMGFTNFLVRKTGRFFNHDTLQEQDEWPCRSRGQEYVIRPPRQQQYRNQSMLNLPMLRQQYPGMQKYFDTTPIHCDALLGRKVAINADGVVLPCNFFNHNLHDQRFHEPDVLPGAHALSQVNGKNQVREFLTEFGLDNLNIHSHSLEDIFANPMWDALIQGWNRTLAHGRMFECAMTCGSKLTKVWDQGGNKR